MPYLNLNLLQMLKVELKHVPFFQVKILSLYSSMGLLVSKALEILLETDEGLCIVEYQYIYCKREMNSLEFVLINLC